MVAIVATAGQLIEESSADIAVLFCQAELVRFYSVDGWASTPPGIVQSASAAPVAMVRAASVRGAAISAGLTNADGLSVAPLVLDTAW